MKPDPGRVTARRLNRAEYTNTIRDLLAIEFRADKNFPTDDSGEGFDNIGDVLTVSPVLMEKYLSAAGRIAERAIAAGPLPKPIEVEYSLRFKNLRRLDPSNVEATHRFDFDADYELKLGLPGQRAADAAPVTLGLWVDGKLANHARSRRSLRDSSTSTRTPRSGSACPCPRAITRFGSGSSTTRSSRRSRRTNIYKDTINKWIGSVTVIGPFATEGRETEPQARPGLRSGARIRRCVRPDPRDAGAPRLPPAGDRIGSRRAEASSSTWRGADGQSVGAGDRPRDPGDARLAALPVPHRARSLPDRPDRVHRISDVELASRLSYFLWNSMPDEELLSLAERRRLSAPAGARRAGEADARRSEGVRDGRELRRPVAGDPQSRQHQAGSAEVPGLGSRAARRDEDRDADVLRLRSCARTGRSATSSTRATRSSTSSLAKHYGIDGVHRPGVPARRAHDQPERGGVLSHGSVLAVSSYPTRTSVVIRGKYILQNILGTPPRRRRRTCRRSTSRPSGPRRRCASRWKCIGRTPSAPRATRAWIRSASRSRTTMRSAGGGRWTADSRWIRAACCRARRSFRRPPRCARSSASVVPSSRGRLTEKMLIYALGRGLERYDKPTVRDITTRVGASGYGFQTLVREVVRSLPFQSRRGEAVPTVVATK